MRFSTKPRRGRKPTQYVMVGASKLGFVTDKEAQKCKATFYGSIDKASGVCNPYWQKMSELNVRAVMEYAQYLNKYKVKDE